MSSPEPGRPPAAGRGASAGALGLASAILRRLARAASWLAVIAGLSGLAVWWALRRAVGADEARLVILLVSAVLLAAPPVILALFGVAARTLADLPRRLREAPSAVSERVAEIRSRAAELGEARHRGAVRSFPAVVRLWRAVGSSRELLEEIVPFAFLLSPGLVALAAVAAPAALVEILLGFIALIWLGLS